MQDHALQNKNDRNHSWVMLGKAAAVAGLLLLASCGGGGDGGASSPASTSSTYTIGGTVSGLAAGASVVLQNNGADNRAISANGPFTFATALGNSSAYNTSILTPPANQPCTSTYGVGTVKGANVTNINVFCGPAFVGAFSAAGQASGSFSGTATLLPNGRVLMAGSGLAGIYDSATNTWSAAGSLVTSRSESTATLLPNGKVLLAGGYVVVTSSSGTVYNSLANAERYDPATNTWTAAGSLASARYGHSATLLTSGKVLVTGGWSLATGYLASTELYDPATNTWSVTGSMATQRSGHTATLLPNGKVLVAGGCACNKLSGSIAGTELYDPATSTWSPAGSMATARDGHSATLLPNGKVLVAGGSNPNPASITQLASAELYDPTTNTWSAAGSMATARDGHSAMLLPNGKVLVAGGCTCGNVTLSVFSSAELYDPATNSWSATGSMATPRYFFTATLLPSGKVLVAGGNSTSATAELYW